MRATYEGTEEFLRHSNWIESEYSERAYEQALTAWKFLIENDKVTPEVILHAHRLLMAVLRPDIAGFWRNVDVYIGGKRKKFTSVQAIEAQIELLCEMMNDSKEVSLDRMNRMQDWTKNVHVEFEETHPFEDGNGRIGRMLYNWHRLKLGLPLHIIHEGDEQMDYYKWFK